MLYHLLMEE
jgi:hypothetical protein